MNFQRPGNDLGLGQVMEAAQKFYQPQNFAGNDALQSGMKAMTRYQLEMWSLASRRTRATMSLPAQLAQCRSPNAVMGVYADFWRTAFEECADTTQRLSSLLGASQQPASNAQERSRQPDAPKVVLEGKRRSSANGLDRDARVPLGR